MVLIEGGRIHHRRRRSFSSWWKNISWIRLLMIGIILLCFVATNPLYYPGWIDFIYNHSYWYYNKNNKNKKRNNHPKKYHHDYYQQQELQQQFFSSSRRITDYGIVAIAEQYDGIVVSGLLSTWKCPYSNHHPIPINNNNSNHNEMGNICVWIGHHLCHSKPLLPPWKKKSSFSSSSSSSMSMDRPYIAHRMICYFLILSSIYSYCWHDRSSYSSSSSSSLLSLSSVTVSSVSDYDTTTTMYGEMIQSVLYRPNNSLCLWNSLWNLVLDIIRTNVFIYPALIELDRVLLFSNTIDFIGNPNLTYTLLVIGIVIGLGGGSNVIGSYLAPRHRHRHRHRHQHGRQIGGGGEGQRKLIHGLDSTIAVCCMYYSRTVLGGGEQSFFQWFSPFNNRTFTITVDVVFWSQFFITMIHHYHYEYWFHIVIVWILGGISGSILGNYHSQNQLWVYKVMDFFMK